MSKLYRINVTDVIRTGGVGTYLTTGDAIDVDGVSMVRLTHGSIIPAAGFHETLQAAQASAADQIAEIGRRVTQQAECLREASSGTP